MGLAIGLYVLHLQTEKVILSTKFVRSKLYSSKNENKKL